MTLRILTQAACIALTLMAGGAQAQQPTFPTKPLKIVVPTSAGSGSDITARYFAEQLTTALGQRVLVS